MATRVSFADPPVVRRLAAPVLQPPMNPAASFVQNKLQQAPFSHPQSPSLAGRTAFSSMETGVSNEVVQKEICTMIGDLFPEQKGLLYCDLLKKTKDLNAQCDGWSLLHYCMHQMGQVSEEERGYLFDMIHYLVRQGARLDLEDDRGRTPISFASSVGSEIDEEFWDFLIEKGANLNPLDSYIPPLHVACSLPGKSIRDFLAKGANPYALDEYNRTALHCLAIHGAPKSEVSLQNLELLLSVCPGATAFVDEVGNYPLYYALIFAPKDLWEPILRATPTEVVEKVRAKIATKGVPLTEEKLRLWKTVYRINSPIYFLPGSFQEEPAQSPYLPPGGQDLLKSLDEAVQKKELRVISPAQKSYYAHHDGHGWSYCLFTEKTKQLCAEDPDGFMKEESQKYPLFSPSFIKTPLEYEKLVSECVCFWVNSGANPSAAYVEFDCLVGAVNGKKTCRVKIEGALDPRGAHIVPF